MPDRGQSVRPDTGRHNFRPVEPLVKSSLDKMGHRKSICSFLARNVAFSQNLTVPILLD